MSVAETTRAVTGACRLAVGDRNGLLFFDTSVGGFWRSFRAALIVLPIYAFVRYMDFEQAAETFPLASYATAELFSYVLKWITYPLAMIYICDLLGKFDRYYAYITVYNWAGVVQMLGFFCAMLLGSALSDGMAGFLLMMVMVAILVYEGYIAVVVLDVPVISALALVVIDMLLAVMIVLFSHSAAAGSLTGSLTGLIRA